MEEIVTALAEQHHELAVLLDGLDEAGWHRDTRCDGWNVADVVLHLAQSDEIARASVRGRFDEHVSALGGDPAGVGPSVDEGVDRLVAEERGSSNAEIHARWSRASTALRAELSTVDPHERVWWVAGDMAARTLATTRLAETWIHAGDVALALDVDLAPTDRLWHIARLAWRTLPYAFDRDGRPRPGPVAFRLTAPDGGTWEFAPDAEPGTVITGDALDLCLVAARRILPKEASLRGDGPDAGAVLELVRTWA